MIEGEKKHFGKCRGLNKNGVLKRERPLKMQIVISELLEKEKGKMRGRIKEKEERLRKNC